MPQGWGQQVLHVGRLNSFLDLGDGNLTAKNRKIQMPGGAAGGGGGGGFGGKKVGGGGGGGGVNGVSF